MTKPEQDLDYRDQAAFDEAEDSRRRDEAVSGASAEPEDPEASAAAEGLTVTDAEAKAYRESVERGAHQQGEGAPDF